MKKIFLLCSMIITYCASANAQGLTTTSTTVTSGATITVTGTGESKDKYFTTEYYLGKTVASPNPESSVSVPNITGFAIYNQATKAPTTFQFQAVSTASVPVTVTYHFRMVPYDNVNLKQLPAVDCDITVTINPKPIPQGTYARLMVTYATPGDVTSPWDVSIYFYQNANATGPLTVTNLPVSYNRPGGRGSSGPTTQTVVVTGQRYSIIQIGHGVREGVPPTLPTPTELGYSLNQIDGYIVYY